MPEGQHYAEQLGELRRHVAEPVRGIILVEFATIPQIDGIVANLRALDPARACLEVPYDPPRENAVVYLDHVRQELSAQNPEPLPLLVLRPSQLPDPTNDQVATIEFWRALNFRRETLGALPAQILLCVDPWHHDRLVTYADDLRNWTAPKFHLLPSATDRVEPSEGLAALSSFVKFAISLDAARRRWETFWPELERVRTEHRLGPGHVRRYILPLLEAALAQGNLVRARQVRDAAQNVSIPDEDVIQWHQLNVMLACAAQDFASAEDHTRKLLEMARHHADESIRRKAFHALWACTSLLDDFGQFVAAEELLREQCELSAELNGPEHPNTLASRNILALVLKSEGKHAEAEREHKSVQATYERVLGPEHPATLANRNNLATVLRLQGKHAEAEQEHRAVLAIHERVLGPEHPNTLTSRNNLANALLSQGKYAEGECEHREVLAIRERVLGPKHPNVFRSYLNVALCLEKQGNASEALPFAQRAWKGWSEVLGEKHLDTQNAKALAERLEKG
jgi:tetratricopeptide (TPR) repeat protein